MSEDPNPVSLTMQLTARVKSFCAATGISQKQLARYLHIDQGHFSAFLSGNVNMSAERTLKLVQLMNQTKAQVGTKFSKSEKLIHLEHVQESGKPMRLDWVPGQSGEDPNDSTDITGTVTARDLDNADDYQAATIAFLKDQQNIHRSAIGEIQKYLDLAPKAQVNPTGSAEPIRQTDDNERSRTPGPRPDRFRAADRKGCCTIWKRKEGKRKLL